MNVVRKPGSGGDAEFGSCSKEKMEREEEERRLSKVGLVQM